LAVEVAALVVFFEAVFLEAVFFEAVFFAAVFFEAVFFEAVFLEAGAFFEPLVFVRFDAVLRFPAVDAI
jgi:hypothetical protein